jgi:long-chain acyl-CoA synthetase
MTDATTTASGTSLSYPSVGAMFLSRVAETPDRPALRYPAGDGWGSLTWQQTGDRVKALAAGLMASGIKPEERVAIASGTCYEWILADLAIMCAGAATTTVYPSTPVEDVGYILGDSGSRLVFAEDDSQVDKVEANRAALPDLGLIVNMTGAGNGSDVLSLAELEARGREHLAANPTAVEDAVAAVKPDQLATIIYTSGTTGKPKGVRLTQSNWVYTGDAIAVLDLLGPDDVQYLWLPMAHSFGKVLESAMVRIGFETAVDGRVPQIVPNLAVIKPTFMAAVPRIFEKVYAKVGESAHEPGLKGKIAGWAFTTGGRVAALKQEGKNPGPGVNAQYALADKLVFSKVRERFGGRVRYFVSGSAALSRDIALFFEGAGLTILEGYGLTETSAYAYLNPPDGYRFGTVGKPAAGTEVKIAEDGEILLRGPGVMTGYHNLPEETAEVFSEDGWFHTGDIGHIEDGLLRITDRKKDLIKTSGGKYVAPQGVETLFKATCPYASQIVVHGDNRNYCTALVTLDADAIQDWAAKHGLGGKSYTEIVTSPEAKAMVQSHIDEMNTQLPKWETIKKFVILPEDLTIDGGDLTPSLKVKRKVVEKKYMDLLDSLYA